MQVIVSQMTKVVPQMSTTMLAIVCASESHVCEFNKAESAFSNLSYHFYHGKSEMNGGSKTES